MDSNGITADFKDFFIPLKDQLGAIILYSAALTPDEKPFDFIIDPPFFSKQNETVFIWDQHKHQADGGFPLQR